VSDLVDQYTYKMNGKTALLLLWTFFVYLLTSCQGDETHSGGKVELYLLESFTTIDHSCQIDDAGITLEDGPLIPYSDLVSYNSSEHIFELSEHGKETISDQDLAIHGKPFGVAIDGEVIYTGYFWASFSSSICQWITTDPLFIELNNGLKMQLGYPGQIDGIEIPDKRNDPRILATFKRDGKLIG
jgi:hypothetical protein